MAGTLTFTIEGYVDVLVNVTETDEGLEFAVTVDESEGKTADLRGLFWDVADESVLAGLLVNEMAYPDISESRFEANSVIDFGHGANMKGKVHKGAYFDAGVEIGTAGANPDDIQTTTFFVEGLTLDDIGGQRFGVRLTSVGEAQSGRGKSLKLVDMAGYAPEADDDAFTADEDTLIVDGSVLDNDSDEDGTVLEVTDYHVISGAGIADGSLVVNADGSFSFEPVTSFTGDVVFAYEVSDEDGNTRWAEATVAVEEVAGITVTLAEVPIDIVMAFDLSGSFADDLPNIQNPRRIGVGLLRYPQRGAG